MPFSKPLSNELLKAATSLDTCLRGKPGFCAVGVTNASLQGTPGAESLIVYVKNGVKVSLPQTWDGFPLTVKRTSGAFMA